MISHVYMLSGIAILFVICSYLIVKNLIYKRQLNKLSMQIFDLQTQNEDIKYSHFLKEKEFEISRQYLDDKLQDYQNNLNLAIQSHQATMQETKQQYEEKIAQQETIIFDMQKNHTKEILSNQEMYEKKLFNLLQEQEKNLATKNTENKDLLQEILNAEREKQEAVMMQRFHELGDKLLEEKSKQFQEKQEISLKPLCEELIRFKAEVAQNTKENMEKQIALSTEIKHLRDTSMQISKDANNLAHAMKGDYKIQGQWGEIILERLLEKSGLQKNREYYTQFSIQNDMNEKLRPDVVIQLPNNRFVVVDSKVSLNAYNTYFNEENKDKKDLQLHFESVKNHVKSLYSKQYQQYVDGAKLDFVIMFMPIEGAYSAILQNNLDIFLESYEKGIIIASPTTLMVILRLIHHIWTNEAKDKNMQKILGECIKLIKKFDSFTESMGKINRALDNAKNAYDKADTQLRGKGSISSYIRNLDTYMSKIDDTQDVYAKNELLKNDNGKNQEQLDSNIESKEVGNDENNMLAI